MQIRPQIKTITLTTVVTTTLLLGGLVGFATLAPTNVKQPTNAANHNTVAMLFTPKGIHDFNNPQPSISALFDTVAPTLAPQSNLILILATGSNEHILHYGTTPTIPSLILRAPETHFSFPTNTVTQNRQLTSLSLEPHGPFSLILPVHQPTPITASTGVQWSWRTQNAIDLVIRFSIRNTATQETDTLTYRAEGHEHRKGFDMWEDFMIDDPTQTPQPTIALAQDLFRKRAPDQNTHHIEQESWVIDTVTVEGTSEMITMTAPQTIDSGISWARNTYGSESLSPVAQQHRVYPQLLTYTQLKNMVQLLHKEAQRRGISLRVLDAIEGSTEFSRQDWLYGDHPEALFIPNRPAAPTINLTATLNTDTAPYAAYPNGIPDRTTAGTFIAQQITTYINGLNLDGVYFMNAFGIKAPWYPQVAPTPTDTDTQAFIQFYQSLRTALPDKYLLWMDSYYPRWVEQEHYGIPEQFYTLIDGLQISTFWQNTMNELEIRWNPEGMFGTIQETIQSKLRLKKNNPHLDLFWTWYVRDPWYPLAYEEKTNTTFFTQNKNNFSASIIYSANDTQGDIKILPQKIIDALK